MLPRYLALVLIAVSSAFYAKGQDRKISTSFTQGAAVLRSAVTKQSPAHKTDTVPCQCAALPQIIAQTGTATNRTYQGIPNAACFSIVTTAALSPGIKTGQRGLDTCGVAAVVYSWSITAGNNIAAINGGNSNPTVNVVITGSGTFTLRLENTVTCSDGSTCSNFAYYNDSARLDSSHCTCTAGPVRIQPANKQGNVWTYQGTIAGTCTGQYGITPNLLPCAVQNTLYKWSIDGGGVASIVGGNNGQSVNVAITGNGAFNLRLDGTTVCSDGTTCTNYNFYQDSAKTDSTKACHFLYTETNQPAMAGGLSDQTKKKSRIRRDEFIALIAEGKDYDKVTIECTPSYECDSAQQKNTKEVLLAGKVRFEWEIQQGDGNFVKLGILPKDVQEDEGDRVIFQPPYVPLPENGNENFLTTVLILSVIDETGSGALLDEPVHPQIIITTKRFKNDPDYYEVEVSGPDWTPPSPALQENNEGVCKASFGWEKDNDLKRPELKLPDVPDNNKMVLGQWMVLNAENQNETDELKMVCEATDCGTDGGQKAYPDNIEWIWTIQNDDGKKGTFVGGNKGRYVIYAAPDSLPAGMNELSVGFIVEIKNTGIQLDDKPQKSAPVAVKVYQPGVQLEYPPLDWVPKAISNDAFVKLKSYLLYKENGIWKEALAHMGRIHFFELLEVSQEKGFCMNSPDPKTAESCRDLLFEGDEHTEVFDRPNDPALSNCAIKNTYYIHARSQKPQKEEMIDVISDDQGAYGFLRSFANINQGGRDSIKGELPVYVPVPIAAEKVPHPAGRPKKHIYTDNRVTVPRDVDENRIADGGWRTRGNALMKDPADPQGDDDDRLPGDGYPGDGLSNYEEYRGFLTDGHQIRTNIRNKDLFIHNPNSFHLGIFRAALSAGAGQSTVGVDIHEIRRLDYVDNQTREINFNYNPRLHFVPPPGEPLRVQKGLWIIDGGEDKDRPKLLGQTFTSDRNFVDINTPPNWVAGMAIFTRNIRKYAPRVGVNADRLITHVATHELGHGIAMWHHGDAILALHGLQSGNVNCIMRYDNVLPVNIREASGVTFCNHARGTGNNALNPCQIPVCYGDATRGDCIHQFRISCRTIDFPKKR